jgi:hypothetical protein
MPKSVFGFSGAIGVLLLASLCKADPCLVSVLTDDDACGDDSIPVVRGMFRGGTPLVSADGSGHWEVDAVDSDGSPVHFEGDLPEGGVLFFACDGVPRQPPTILTSFEFEDPGWRTPASCIPEIPFQTWLNFLTYGYDVPPLSMTVWIHFP